MASRDTTLLSPGLQASVRAFTSYIQDLGIDLIITCTLRDCWEQARLFRRGRTMAQIRDRMDRLSANGHTLLSGILDAVGPQGGLGRVTNAGPGESWHQYGEAFDVVPLWHGKPLWNPDHNPSLWTSVGEAGERSGLQWGGRWDRPDVPHFQSLEAEGNPLDLYAPGTVREILEQFKTLGDEEIPG